MVQTYSNIPRRQVKAAYIHTSKLIGNLGLEVQVMVRIK